ncbi:MAG: bifunctional cytidylyltransferase/SDR family oxidoreductase [Propionibacteriaceae bacterium]|nr:bifunctional cytidylyltransferase/SDR family oxidoreductase [Propionibacteriaceae bacterium]
MDEQPLNIGVILAGGTGTRVGLSIPKQLIKVAGKPIMEHTIEVFQDAELIDEIYLIMHPDYLDTAKTIAKKYPKITKILSGGETRNDSTHAALDAMADLDPATKVLFHDSVRPLLDIRIINDCIDALDSYDAVDVAIPSADTIITLNSSNEISAIPDRSTLGRGQTPQGFRLGVIQQAYELAWQDQNFSSTDDCGVVHQYLPDVAITVVKGADQNMKITEPIDVFIADKLFQVGSTAPPAGSDVGSYFQKLNGKVLVVIGGGYGIGKDIVTMTSGFGAWTFPFSRSLTETHVEDIDEVEAALKSVYEKTGRIDYIVVTAGLLNRGPLAEVPLEEITKGIQVNYMGPVNAARAGYKYLKESHGQLIFFTSSSYTRGRADYSIYSSSKAAVVNLVQALADEWSADGIQVNVINPERTATPMRTKAFGEEPPGTLLSSQAVALTTIDVLLSNLTGHVIDVRRIEPPRGGMSRTELEAARIAMALTQAQHERTDFV